MYAAYFGLDETPFSITPDPRYLFLGARHSEALAHLLYGIEGGSGFIQLTGEVGTGKTTLIRCLLEELPAHVDVALVLNPRQSVQEFLRSICEELHLEVPRDAAPKDLIDTLNRALLNAHARGRRTVLIIDEAQNLSRDLLEQVRLLTNLETAKTKLLQILLIGQPELRETLARPDLRQLAQRITARYHLEPLNRRELADYVRHRLRVAGAQGEIFTSAALAKIWRFSGGVPRLVNILCDRALLGAYAREQRRVSGKLVNAAAREAMPPKRRWQWAGAAMLLLFAAAASGFSLWQLRPPETPEPEPRLTDWLAEHRHLTGTDTALANLFDQWQGSYQPGHDTACTQAETQGLKCLYEQATWRRLLQLNRPAVLTLVDETGNSYHLLARRLDEGRLELAAGDAEIQVSQPELSALWPGEMLALWRPPALAGNTLTVGSRGAGVIWLREQLAAARGEAPDPAASEEFDENLAEQLRKFQAEHQLQADGIAGARTLIQLNSLRQPPGTPLLAATACQGSALTCP